MRERYEIMKAMHIIVQAMNNEDAYMKWILTVPDEASDEELFEIAEDEELFADACSAFKSVMKTYIKDGLYIANKLW